MVNIIKKELSLEESLKKKIEFLCDFTNTKPTIINGNIRKVDRTNLIYIEPHRIIINNITFLAFNYSNEIFIENLSNKIKLSEFIQNIVERLFNYSGLELKYFKQQYDSEVKRKDTNRFKGFNLFNKKEVEKANKHINDEMDEYAEEFYDDKKDKEKDDDLSL